MVQQGGRGGTIYCAILIAKYNEGGGGAIKEVMHATNSIDQCTIPELKNEYIVKAKTHPRQESALSEPA